VFFAATDAFTADNADGTDGLALSLTGAVFFAAADALTADDADGTDGLVLFFIMLKYNSFVMKFVFAKINHQSDG
jgi:hypothetical protein